LAKVIAKESFEISSTTKYDMTVSEPQLVVPLIIVSNTKTKVNIDSSTAIIIYLNNAITLKIQKLRINLQSPILLMVFGSYVR